MHWLLTLDTGLFHFINRSLSNPLFDWLMPILSGGGDVMRWFVLSAVVLALAALCFGSTRARLCAVTMLVVSLVGNALVVNVIKHAVARPRPCIALPDAIARLGCTTSGSMPSAHAANWFAATMVAFLFYRKSWRFMLPMALAVAFSRVYNGVHYPSDVLAGAVLGAGYAAAGTIVLQAAWNWIGRKWFPLWHARMPSLLKAEDRRQKAEIQNSAQPSTINHQPSTTDSHWLRLGAILIFAMLIGRWFYLASGAIELSQDEAYQWVWSKHLALSYYSKPPGIALIQFVSTSLLGDTEFGVRFFSPLFAAIVSLMLLRFLAREVGARLSFWLLVIATATPLLGVGTILMTIDPPLVLCWIWALVAGWRAAQPDGKTRDWLMVGLAMGLGFLCKYTAFYQIICFGIYFALWPMARTHLRKPGPWLALLVFSICTLPVVIWNSQHGWITVHHVAGNAGLHGRWHPTLRYFWDFIFQELALLNPVFFIGAIWAMIGFWKFRRERPLWLSIRAFCRTGLLPPCCRCFA
jgi:membrane-associated phospholipid phosphatase